VREGGDTKTKKSKRTLAMSGLCVDALRRQRVQQASERLAAGDRWEDTGLVFTTALGTAMDAANVRRDFRRALRLVPGLTPDDWTPRYDGLWRVFDMGVDKWATTTCSFATRAGVAQGPATPRVMITLTPTSGATEAVGRFAPPQSRTR
jgi:hypothetical protein